jgi:hypothetical protein
VTEARSFQWNLCGESCPTLIVAIAEIIVETERMTNGAHEESNITFKG